MFSGITGYLFGNTTASDSIPNKKTDEVNLQTTETDGDWLLVNASQESQEEYEANSDIFDDKSSSVASLCGYEDDLAEQVATVASVDKDNELRLSMTMAMASGPASSSCGENSTPTVASPAPSTPTSGASLEGSWYITPPPCFMLASGATVETSPLENLLIEHPSMSVYGPPRCCAKRPASVSTDPESSLSNEGSLDMAVLPKDPEPVAVEEPISEALRPQAAANDAALALARDRARVAAILADVVGVTAASQRGKKQVDKKYANRNQLGRQNKVQQYGSHGHRQRRKDRIKNPSGMNNNRGC